MMMMTTKEHEIKRLTERFFEGETTLDEEKTLYAYYSQADIAAELAEYAEVMRSFAMLPIKKEVKTKKVGTARKIYRRIAVAASITLLLGTCTFFLLKPSTPDEECVAYIYGKKSTDRVLIAHEVRRSMDEICEMSEDQDIKEQLQDLFTLE